MAHGSRNASSWVVIIFLGGNPPPPPLLLDRTVSEGHPRILQQPVSLGPRLMTPMVIRPWFCGDDFSSLGKIVNRGRYRTGRKLVLNNLLYGSPVTSCQSCANPWHVNRRTLDRGVVSGVAKRLSNGLVADWRCPRVASLRDPVLSDHVRNGDVSLDGNKLY
jgi:hypothetical protein